jgi:hypothetical protein
MPATPEMTAKVNLLQQELNSAIERYRWLPSPDHVAAISSAWSSLDTQMNEEWEKNYILDWSPFAKKREDNGH